MDTLRVLLASTKTPSRVPRFLRKLSRSAVRRFLETRSMLDEVRWQRADRAALDDAVRRKLSVDAHGWVFILGLNDSGTTLLQNLMGSHRMIRLLPDEGQVLTDALPASEDYGVARVFTERMDVFRWTEASDPTPAARARFQWRHYYGARPGFLLEKSPPNILRSRWLQKNFEPARFIALARDPYAVSEGIRRRTGRPLEIAARHWLRGNACMAEDLPRLDHCLRLTYEQLCRDPMEQLERVRRFLGLAEPFSPLVLDRPIKAPTIDRRWHTIRDLNDASMSRLSADDLAAITRIAWPFAATLGYEARERLEV